MAATIITILHRPPLSKRSASALMGAFQRMATIAGQYRRARTALLPHLLARVGLRNLPLTCSLGETPKKAARDWALAILAIGGNSASSICAVSVPMPGMLLIRS